MQMQSGTDVPVLSHVGTNALLASTAYQDEYAAGLMKDAQDGLPQLSFQMRETAFYKQQNRATPKSNARQRTVADLLFGAAAAEYEELQSELGISDPEYMGSTFVDCLDDPCAPRDNFLIKAQKQLGFSEDKTRKAYLDAGKRVAAAHIEWATPVDPKPAKSKDDRPVIYGVVDNLFANVMREISDLDLGTKISKITKRSDFDPGVEEYVVEVIAEKTVWGKRAARKAVQESATAMRKKTRPKKEDASTIPVVSEWSDHDMVEWAQDKLASATDKNGDPVMYDYNRDVAGVRDGQRYMFTDKEFTAELNTHTNWEYTKQSGESRYGFAPRQVGEHNYHRSDKAYPKLNEVKPIPYFTNDGRRVDQHGYDSSSETYLDLGGLVVPPVSDVPSKSEVIKAKRLLTEPICDFPLDGITGRKELFDRGLLNRGAALPSLAHTICMMIERAARDLIGGPTPVYTPTKPLPGTGAGGLVAAVTLLATGRKAAAEPMPATEEEYTKVMGAHISHSEEFAFFDNMNAALDLGPFASNVSEGRVRTRLLGSSRMIEAEVRHTWIAAANNIKGTSEILRRMVMIELDAKVPNPEYREPAGGWRHKDLTKWIEQSRAKLVWAILTLIQNWVAKGMEPWEGKPKASFEAWSRVMGGILRDANIRGFLGNESRLRSYGATGGDSGLEIFMQHVAENHESGTLFRAGGIAEIRGREGETVHSIKDELNGADDEKPLLMDGWGYSREDQQYNHARGIGTKFRDAARRAYEVTLYELRPDEDGEMKEVSVRYAVSFKEEPDPKSPKQYYWELVKNEVE